MSRIRRTEDKYNRAIVKRIREAAEREPEATFDNFEDMMRWLNDEPNRSAPPAAFPSP